MSKPGYRCAECKGTNIQVAMWVNPNTYEVHGDYGSWGNYDTHWCEDCEEHPRIESIPTNDKPNHAKEAT